MRYLVFKEMDTEVYRYPEDVKRLKKVALSNGAFLQDSLAVRIWDEHSDRACASWLAMDSYSDDYLWSIINAYTI